MNAQEESTGSKTTSRDVPDLVPVRMLNEFTYCPRLAYLEYVQQEWEDNVETLEGNHAHRRVDREKGERAEIHDRSVWLSSEKLGLTAKLDLIEGSGKKARPVDYKRGKKPAVAEGAWEPERVQLCGQGLLLREHGFQCNEGVLYFAASKERVRIRFTEQLVERTLELLAQMRESMSGGDIPPPLEDSPKCPRCSLVRICLPEETRTLAKGGPVRPLAASDTGRHPLVVQDPRAGIRLRKNELIVMADRKQQTSARLGETSQVALMGGARITTAALAECCRREIPVLHMSGNGWLYGVSTGIPHKNVELRIEQYAAAKDSFRSLEVARRIVAAKIANCRVLLRRNGQPGQEVLDALSGAVRRATKARDAETLLGIEGSAARLYYEAFPGMIKADRAELGFDFTGRNRRPPKDPVNALISFAAGLLLKDWLVTLRAVGFDPYLGLFHRPRYGKPALALDLMEPFRPVVGDSVAIGVLNNGEVGDGDFIERTGGVLLRPAGRRSVVLAYERRIAQEVKHPTFGYRVTYRRLFELEARLLARHLLGETPSFEPFRIR